MDLNKYKAILNLMAITVLSYLIHKTIFFILDINDTNFIYAIEVLYLIFILFSTLIVLLLLKVKDKSFDNVGMTFLLATSIKMVFCYLVLRPILLLSNTDSSLEKINFFAVFILFLALETVITIRLVNEPQ